MSRSLKSLCARVRCESVYGGAEVPEDFAPGTHPYKVTLRYQGRQLTVPFFMGPALEREPDAVGVLECLLSDVSCVEGCRDFEDFCADLGYDVDSRKAEAMYKACEALYPKLRRFLGSDFSTFMEAER